MIKLDSERREYEMLVIGEEAHVAYNRVGLTDFFETRKIEDLYLNPAEWYESQKPTLNTVINTKVVEILPETKQVRTASGELVGYDILVLATGSDAVIPASVPGHDATGVFVYRNIDDLEKLIRYSSVMKGSTAAVVGGGLLGLEAAKALMDLKEYGAVKLIDRNRYVLARQLDSDAGMLVMEKIRDLGLEVLTEKRVKEINKDEKNQCTAVTFEDGERMECSTLCYAIGIKPRDELAEKAGIITSKRTGGYTIDESLQTNIEGIYAVGECASWEDQTFGLIAPGVEMADVLSYNLTLLPGQERRKFRRPDLSTKLKLLGVDVASFGDFFADRDGPRELPSTFEAPVRGVRSKEKRTDLVKAISFRDPFAAVYKKYLFTMDGKYLLGGMMIGDTRDYIKLVQTVKLKKPLEVPPSQFILGAKKEGEEDNTDDLDDDTQVCACHNVTKGDIAKAVKDGTCKTISEVKTCTKAGTGCAGCMPLITSIFNGEMKKLGQEVSNHLCQHFPYTRVDLYNIIAVKKLRTFPEVMAAAGNNKTSLGCEVCQPTVASIFASLYNEHVMDEKLHSLQETNDKFLANIQRNQTFSVVPRVAGGEITPDKLIAIGEVAKKFNLYCKITGGQRIDLFGARKQDLVEIWTMLVDAGMESGHAYAKSLRTVKSCVGSTWCRFGLHDSVGMAIRLEERYKSVRAPHKFKSGVSGCVRECAEAQSKDFGLIATEKGFNIFVGGNGGSKPRHAELLVKDCPPDSVVPVLDRFLMLYIRTADKLQRTARWIENLPGGIQYLREVILEDKLGICAELEQQMANLVGSFFCEWTEVVRDPVKRKMFQQFVNTEETVDSVEMVTERDQQRPAFWPKEPARVDFKGHKWSSLTWQPLVKADHFRDANSAAVKRGDTQLAIFKVRDKFYATQQMCPHKRAFVLSDGMIGEDASAEKKRLWVSCPYHKRNFTLGDSECGVPAKGDAGTCTNDEELSIATFEAREEHGWVKVRLPPVEELDKLLGTKRWMVGREETEKEGVFEVVERKYGKGMRGRKVEIGIKGQAPPNSTRAVTVGGGSGGLDW
ncbi:nitrite reductase [Ascobolus immersus RN42]|uniref:Nitrite reductase [NAD(P)H] n=1 Tax=Ascobolus immersus RN42 TaxID=1160509 RepID=A0A3N4HDJ0_ASCIM|nr:nitrite reductase [Ascobolus immersus RN42]